MTLSIDVSLKQYVKLMFALAYRKPVLILLVIFDLLMIGWIVGFYLGWSLLPEPEYPQYLTVLLISVVQPLVIFFTVRKNYKSSTRLYSAFQLTFTTEKLTMRGDLFYSEFSWHKAYKLVELKNWFLIYENTLAAILIDKSDISLKQQEEFKALVKTIPDLELKLRS